MFHTLFFDGNPKRICWSIKTDDVVVDQFRDHADIYLDVVSNLQSKYIALHVGIFWGIGVFIIKNGDTVKIQFDSDEMIKHLSSDIVLSDKLLEDKKKFINQLASQRALVYQYEKIENAQNISSKML
ncbi:MAG: hypothetical protein ACT4OD_02580 [Candidatus Nitrosotenuis sp.]